MLPAVVRANYSGTGTCIQAPARRIGLPALSEHKFSLSRRRSPKIKLNSESLTTIVFESMYPSWRNFMTDEFAGVVALWY